MRKIIMFALASMFLISCGGDGKEPTDLISMGTAFNHCFSTTSYVLWLIASIIVLGVVVFFSLKAYRNGDVDGKGFTWRVLLGLAFFLACLLVRPAEIANNTTVEQAARGAWIGY